MRRIGWWAATFVGFVSILMFGLASTALGSATVPCSAGGDGVVDAVTAANGGGGGTIKLAPGCTYHVSVDNNSFNGSNALPIVTTPITVNGNGATIEGDGSSARIFEVDGPGGKLTLKGLTITGGFEPEAGGGGILNFGGTLTLNNSTVSDNNAILGGGGIATGNPVSGMSLTTIIDSRVDNNTAMFGNGGGGIGNGGTLVVNNSEIADNSTLAGFGGGLLNHGVSATLNNSTVTGNTAASAGGGIANINFGVPTSTVLLAVNGSTVSNNTASSSSHGLFGGGIVNFEAVLTLNPQTQVTGNIPDQCESTGTVARCTS